MTRDYWQLVRAANHLDQFTGYLDTAGKQARDRAKGDYANALSRMSYELIGDLGSADAASALAATELDELATANGEWSAILGRIKNELLAQIEADGRKSGLRRWAKYYSLPIVIALGVTAYLGTWWYDHLTIDKPFETREGLIQRAQSFDKTRQFDELMRGSRSLIMRAVLSAVEPDDAELHAAQEFLGVVLQGQAKLEAEGKVCILPIPNQTSVLAEQRLALADLVSERLQDAKTKWDTPPIMTILPIIAQTQPCPPK